MLCARHTALETHKSVARQHSALLREQEHAFVVLVRAALAQACRQYVDAVKARLPNPLPPAHRFVRPFSPSFLLLGTTQADAFVLLFAVCGFAPAALGNRRRAPRSHRAASRTALDAERLVGASSPSACRQTRARQDR